MWLVFALLASMTFACVHVIDSYCIDDIYEKPMFGIIVSSITSLIVLIPAPYILPLLDLSNVNWQIIGAGLLAGMFIQINQSLYFEALSHSDAAIVTAYWNLVPALLPLFSFVIIGEILELNDYIVIGILVLLSTSISLLDSSFQTRWNSFFLIFTASILQVIAILLMDFVFDRINFYLGFMIFTIGLVITGISLLLFSDVRDSFAKNWTDLKPYFGAFLLLEIINLIAYALLQISLSYGKASLVGTIESLVPAFSFLAAFLINKYSKIKINPKIFAYKHAKIFIIICMAICVLKINS